MAGRWVAIWGVAGIVALLGQALWRLTPIAIEAVAGGLTGVQWVVLGAWVVVNAHAEGYRGFHCRFAPRVIARAVHLARNPSLARGILAPLFCMSLFGASRRGVIVARSVFLGVLVLIATVRALSQPWRGIIDAGVVVGLGIGTLSIGYHALRVLRGHAPVDPDLPPGESPAPTQSMRAPS
jgi:hypothetical protein